MAFLQLFSLRGRIVQWSLRASPKNPTNNSAIIKWIKQVRNLCIITWLCIVMQFRRNLLRVSILHAGVAVSVGDWCRWPQHRLLHWPFFYAAFYVTLDQKIPWHVYILYTKLKLGFVNLCFGCGHLSKICFTRVSQNTTTTWPCFFFISGSTDWSVERWQR